jgi:hypothetical protein
MKRPSGKSSWTSQQSLLTVGRATGSQSYLSSVMLIAQRSARIMKVATVAVEKPRPAPAASFAHLVGRPSGCGVQQPDAFSLPVASL